jgi:hypothetical protein
MMIMLSPYVLLLHINQKTVGIRATLANKLGN